MDKEDRSLWLILAGIVLFSLWYNLTRRSDNALWLVLAAVCVLILAYRFYGSFIATRVAGLKDGESGSSAGHVPTGRWVAFACQFASIGGAAIVMGPVLAAQFGYLPGYAWTLAAAVLGGAVHDVVVLAASVRRKGAFLPTLITEELGPWTGLAAWGLVVVALLIFLAVTGSLLADILVGNIWALYVLAATVIAATVASVYEGWLRPGRTGESIGLGLALLAVAIALSARVAMQPVVMGWLANRGIVIALVAIYCCTAAVSPPRWLGRPRAAISGFAVLLAVSLLAVGIAYAAPSLRLPPTTAYTSGHGPLIAGGVFPYLMIVVTAGAISGFNGLATTGITSRLLKSEGDALPVGFGAMLAQSLLVVLLLIGVATLWRWDFYAMMTPTPLNDIERLAGAGQRDWDNLRSALQADKMRLPGGPVGEPRQEYVRAAGPVTTIAAGASWFFKDFPGFRKSWLPGLYRFMFVFQALVLFAAVEAATRVGHLMIGQAATVAMRTPVLSRFAMIRNGRTLSVATATLVFSLLWALLAVKTDVRAVINLFGLVALLMAALGLGAGALTLRHHARWPILAVILPLVLVSVLSIIVAVVNIRASTRYLDRNQALVTVYGDLPWWGPQAGLVGMDRANDIVRQWQARDVARSVADMGQNDVARQFQSRFGMTEAEAQRLVATIIRRATSLTLWSWLQIVLTGLLMLLGVGVAVGRFVGAPLRWPAGVRTPQLAGQERAAAGGSLPQENIDFDI